MKKATAILLAGILILSLCACGAGRGKTVDLSNYVNVTFSGKDLGGRASVSFDKEQFLLDNVNNISFNQKNLKVYRELYGSRDDSAASAILRYFSVDVEPGRRLANGDEVEVVWTFDTEKLETYFKWDYVCTPRTFTVSGLPEAPTFDPFEDLELLYNGNAPYAEVSLHPVVAVIEDRGTYSIEPSTGLKNGDQFTVTFSCEDDRDMISQHSAYPSAREKTYTVSGLNTYVQSIDTISDEDFDQLIDDALSNVWVSGYGVYRDAKYCGYYFFSAKDQPARDVHSDPVANAICFIFRHPDSDDDDARTVYTVVVLENILVDESGAIINRKHEMWKLHNTFTSDTEVKAAFVGVYDEIMHCTDCTTFG